MANTYSCLTVRSYSSATFKMDIFTSLCKKQPGYICLVVKFFTGRKFLAGTMWLSKLCDNNSHLIDKIFSFQPKFLMMNSSSVAFN